MIPFKLKQNSIKKSIQKIVLASLSLFVCLGYFGIDGTNSLFSDSSAISNSSFSAGVWIPDISMDIQYESSKKHKKNKKGMKWEKEKHKYDNSPCIELYSSIEDSTIYYEFSDDGNPMDGEKYDGKCIEIPKEEIYFQAVAVNNKNENWKSELIKEEFEIGKKDKDKKNKGEEKDDENNNNDQNCTSKEETVEVSVHKIESLVTQEPADHSIEEIQKDSDQQVKEKEIILTPATEKAPEPAEEETVEKPVVLEDENEIKTEESEEDKMIIESLLQNTLNPPNPST